MRDGRPQGMLQVLKPKGMEVALGLLGKQLDHHDRMEPVGRLNRPDTREHLKMGDEAGYAPAAPDIDRRLPVQTADDEQDRVFAPLCHVGEVFDQAAIIDPREKISGVDQMNQRILADINVGVVRLFDNPAILQPDQALAIIRVHIGRNGDNWESEA